MLYFLLFATPTAEVFTGLSILLLLLLLLAIVAAAKVAFFSLSAQDIAQLSEEDAPDSRRVLVLRSAPQHLWSTFLICGNLLVIAIVLLASNLIQHFFADTLLHFWNASPAKAQPISYQLVSFNWMYAIQLSVTAAAVASAVLIFNDSMPQWYVPHNKIQLTKWVSTPILVLMRIFYPLNVLLLNTSKIMERRWGKPTQQKKLMDREDIEEPLEISGSNGKNDKNAAEPEVDILKSIIKFNDVTVRQIMTPRMDVVAIDEESSYAELLKIVRDSGYSRIPVYKGDFDNIKGILYVKDLLGHIQEGPDFAWQKLVRTNVLYVPEAKKINELLREFQKQRLHLAIVVDEYGGSAGIVTLEDVLEEIIGDIKDEFDDEAEVQYRQMDENTYLFEGKTLLQDVYRITGIEAGTFDEIRGEADSLAGLILAIHGQLPKKETELGYKNFHFKIIAVNKRRIEQVQLTIKAKEAQKLIQ